MRILSFVLPAVVLSLVLQAQTSAPVKKVADTKAPPAAVKNFKESGSPVAKVGIELYTDYECPACREFYLNVLPILNREYIATGKVHLLHRDFPLPQHKFTKIATRYANAAGQIGKYDLVAKQLFDTQPEWSQNGNIDVQIGKVLPPGDLVKVRELVTSDAHLDDTVNADVQMGSYTDHLQQTPTIVIVANGKREVIGGAPPYSILKQYIDSKLK
ncbi:MAG TPA: thioredoxin domain-containing protein [Bryobacteraceae bacterium]|nr:thioredoxin domain-containing protein [Bryobacteraceae bacterium]